MKEASDLVMMELSNAQASFNPMQSEHEGIAVIREEYIELEMEVFKSPKHRDLEAMKKEAVQLAAMAMRFLVDRCKA